MSFAERLISEPQREKSGETGYERYDYQALWGLALIFEHHGSTEDYAIAFEFHDDIVLLDSASSPTRARFYQVKTKDKGHWTLSDLYRRKPRKDAPTAIPSPEQLEVSEGAGYAGIGGWMETKLGSYRVQDRADVVQVVKVSTPTALKKIRKHLGKVHAIYLRHFDELFAAAKEEIEQERERGGAK